MFPAYRCRVDFNEAQTRNSFVTLAVISKYSLILTCSFVSSPTQDYGFETTHSVQYANIREVYEEPIIAKKTAHV